MVNAKDSSASELFWEPVSNDSLAPKESLAQGDLLLRCSVPVITTPRLDEATPTSDPVKVRVDVLDVIVMTQSCDLETGRATFVACCPIYPVTRFEEFTPRLKKIGAWESVRQGRQEGLHLLGATTSTEDKWNAHVVDFRNIFSLPHSHILQHAKSLEPRWRLRSPYLEHFSQSFARFFMRVGLPSHIPSYDVEPKRPTSASSLH